MVEQGGRTSAGVRESGVRADRVRDKAGSDAAARAAAVAAASVTATADGVVPGPDGLLRCRWATSTPDYTAYHDDEWGRPIRTDQGLYERLTLEAFQSGLSWITILRKRPAFRTAFADFAMDKVAEFGASDVERLMADAGIVRNRAKIDAAIANARAALDLPDGLSAELWSFAPDPRPARPATPAEVRSTSPESIALAKSLRKHGFRFVGPTTAYALMQASGMVDDHMALCHVPPAT
jgi:DNA-3-methyladenine glycosylase I